MNSKNYCSVEDVTDMKLLLIIIMMMMVIIVDAATGDAQHKTTRFDINLINSINKIK